MLGGINGSSLQQMNNLTRLCDSLKTVYVYNTIRFLTDICFFNQVMRKKILYWAKQVAQTLLLLFIISLAVDSLRAPQLPIQAAQTALPIVSRSQTTTLASAQPKPNPAAVYLGNVVRHLQTHIARYPTSAQQRHARYQRGIALGQRCRYSRLFATAKLHLPRRKRCQRCVGATMGRESYPHHSAD